MFVLFAFRRFCCLLFLVRQGGFTISLLKDHLLSSLKLVYGSNIADGPPRRMKANGIVVLHEPSDQAPGVLKRKGCPWPQALAFDGAVPALNLAVALSTTSSWFSK